VISQTEWITATQLHEVITSLIALRTEVCLAEEAHRRAKDHLDRVTDRFEKAQKQYEHLRGSPRDYAA
jgi:hypothetical protein